MASFWSSLAGATVGGGAVVALIGFLARQWISLHFERRLKQYQHALEVEIAKFQLRDRLLHERTISSLISLHKLVIDARQTMWNLVSPGASSRDRSTLETLNHEAQRAYEALHNEVTMSRPLLSDEMNDVLGKLRDEFSRAQIEIQLLTLPNDPDDVRYPVDRGIVTGKVDELKKQFITMVQAELRPTANGRNEIDSS